MNEADLVLVLQQIRRVMQIPALAAAAYIGGELRESAAIGERIIDSKKPVSIS